MGQFHLAKGIFGRRLYTDITESLSRTAEIPFITQAEIMKRLFRQCLLAPTIALVGFAFDTAFADASLDLPKRTPGLWRITTVSPEMGMQTHDVCIAEGDSIIGNEATDCAQPSVQHVGDQVIVTIECGVGAERNVESFLFTGDFKSWYRAQSKLTSGPRRTGFSIDGWLLSMSCVD